MYNTVTELLMVKKVFKPGLLVKNGMILLFPNSVMVDHVPIIDFKKLSRLKRKRRAKFIEAFPERLVACVDPGK